jgi:deoxyribodipyrimidine photo-lyase
MSAPVLVWFRQDLRLSDHPALAEAARRGPVIPVFIRDPDGEGAWAPGGASRWWLHHSLAALGELLAGRGSRLILRQGDSLRCLRDLIRETGAAAVHFSRRHEPAVAVRDSIVTEALRNAGITVGCFGSALLFEPEALRTGSGGPHKVFTPFWKAWQALPAPLPPLAIPHLRAPAAWPDSLGLDRLGLLPKADWALRMRSAWTRGWKGARALARIHLPHLHFGELGPREAWAAAGGYAGLGRHAVPTAHEAPGGAAWRRQLAWREFAHH